MSEKMLRGYMGNALSLLDVFQTAARMRDQFVFVFEDDARIIDRRLVRLLRKLCDDVPRCDLIWLNDYDRGSTKWERIINRAKLGCVPLLPFLTVKRWSAETEKTTEAFMVAPRFAARFAKAFEQNLGACDEHIRHFVAQSDAECYCISPPMFTQADRADSDVR
jgi:hypothetical protein